MVQHGVPFIDSSYIVTLFSRLSGGIDFVDGDGTSWIPTPAERLWTRRERESMEMGSLTDHGPPKGLCRISEDWEGWDHEESAHQTSYLGK